jgi:murein DD-endopeptidase MepM/ murein hydrolase activator NlpD
VSAPAKTSGAAEAFAIRITIPGGASAGTPTVAAPPDTVSLEGGFSYPADGSAVVAGSPSASASTTLGGSARAQASSDVSSLSLFGGEVTVARVTARARVIASSASASADAEGTSVSGLTVGGQATAASGRVTLGDWGYADVAAGSASRAPTGNGYSGQASAIGLAIHLTAPHGSLPAGTTITVGSATATAAAERAAASPRPPPPPPPPTKKLAAPRPVPKTAPTPSRSPRAAPPVRRNPGNIVPQLTAGGHVFPVYGPSSYSDTFGAPRADTGWHHGDDIFAPLGAPVLAVARGTVFSVGWNEVGGNRLWLQDDQGNQYYYAHLSAFSPAAADGRHVEAGDVLGFVGNTGDARGTPYHLHFEIHPASLLHLGYDGVIDPTPILDAWRHLRDLGLPWRGPHGWAAAGTGSGAPEPGAFLLQATDISYASGLDPRSLTHALRDAARAEGDAALLRPFADGASAPAGSGER